MHKRLTHSGNREPFDGMAAECLRKAGWTPTRTVSTAIYAGAYQAEGRSLLPKAKEFLSKFGGLIIQYPTNSEHGDVLAFLAEREIHAMDDSGVVCFEELIGVAPLCPIGHYQLGTCILFMDKRGYVYGGSDATITLVGRTGEEAISNILTGEAGEVLEPNQSDSTR
jgi:hypothetical protein